MNKIDHIKGAIYTAQTMHEAVKKGWIQYDNAKNAIVKWLGFGLPNGESYDPMDYFQDEISGSGSVMKDIKLRKESKEKAWEALEYFDLI